MSNLLVINHIIHQNIYFGEYIILIKQKMASLKIKYRHSSIEGKAGTLFYQVIHNRVARQINSGYKIYPDEWDIFNSQIIIPAKTGENRHRYLVSLKKCIKEDTSRLKDIMIRFENLGYKYTADEIIEYYSAPPVNEYFVSFCENLIEQLRQIGKMRTTETYTTTLNSFKRFMHSRKRDRDIPFDNVDSNLMIEYEQYLNKEIYGLDLATLINKTANKNIKNEVQKDEKGIFVQNDTNSIEIEIYIKDNDTTYKMETFYNSGTEQFVQYYGNVYFKCSKIEYHGKTKKIKYVLFEQI